jgi:hypothetical protein
VTEQYAARIFSKGTLNGGIIEVPGPMDEESMRAMAKSFVTSHGEWHFPRVLPSGAKMAQGTGLTPEKAQMLLSRKFTVTDVARWLGLPPHMIGDLERSTFSNIEHQGQEFVTYSLGPWLSLWEFAINDQLILQPNRFYAEFTRDALVRGDIATRWQAYVNAVQIGAMTRNEVRRKENLKKLPGLDKPLDPAHLTGKQPPKQTAVDKSDEPVDDDEDTFADEETTPPARTRSEAIAHASATRLLRKEITAVQKLAVKHAAHPDAFAMTVTEFYAKHAELVSQTLSMAPSEAEAYCAGQAAQIVTSDWIAAVDMWKTDAYAAGLAAIALEVTP